MSNYYSTHVKLLRKRGSASTHPCAAHPEHAGQQWAYTGLAADEKTGPTHSGGSKGSGKSYSQTSVYSDDINDYVPLCAEHRRLDRIHRNAASTITGEEDETGLWLL